MAGHYQPRSLDRVQRISIHHSVTREPQTVEDELALLLEIGRFHVDVREWPGYAYHLTVAPSGRVYYTGDLHTIRYVVGDGNAENIAICLLGNFTDHAPTDAAIEAARLTANEVRFELGRAVPILGHRETPGTEPTACPGATYADWLPRIAGEPVSEAPTVRSWSRDEIVSAITAAADERGVPRRLLLGAAIAESGLDQYATREQAWPDVSYGIGQQIVLYAPVGDGSNTTENRALVRDWLYDPANAIPLMANKLAGSFWDPNNPGTNEADRILMSLWKYNTGRYRAPGGSNAGNVDNYERSLAEADRIIGERNA